MTRIKKFSIVVLVLASFVLLGVIGFNFGSLQANADTNKVETPVAETENNDTATPYGLLTNLTLYISGGNGEVIGNVENTFTLFPATVRVVVELYKSETFEESYADMTFVCRDMTEDLNMGHTVQTKASTNGEQLYWKARTYYKIDNKDWQERETKAVLYDANGVAVK